MNNREIKYRVWNVDEKRFHKNLDQATIGAFMVLAHNTRDIGKCKYFFQQSTGIKDKNGKLIYEGDFIKFKHNSEAMLAYDVKYKYFVVWQEEDASFVVGDSGDSSYYNNFYDMYDVEVIGNVFDLEK